MTLHALSPQQKMLLKQAMIFHQAGKISDAKEIYTQILQAQPRNAEVLRLIGIAQIESGNLETGVHFLRQSLQVLPEQPDIFFRIGAALQDIRKFHEAIGSFDQALRLKPLFVEALINRGDCYYDLKQFEEAVSSYERALTVRPNSADAYFSRGNALMEMGRVDDALASYDKALMVKRDFVEALYNRAHALMIFQRCEEAIVTYDQLISINPTFADVHLKRGNILLNMKRFDEALTGYERALKANPNFAEAYRNRGIALRGLGRLQDALASLDKALTLKEDFADAYLDKGNILQDMQRPAEAVSQYDEAISIKPNLVEAHNNRGNALQSMDRHEEALTSYDEALALNPDYEWLYGQTLFTRMHLSDWSQFHDRKDQLVARISSGQKAAVPFQAQAVIDDPETLHRAAVTYAAANYAPGQSKFAFNTPNKHAKIRIGYFSSDFRNHPVTHLLAGMFEWHDRAKFEIFAFSCGATVQDEWQRRVTSAVDNFIDVSLKSDFEIVNLVRDCEIDIAVDLNGFTKGGRMRIFSERIAPSQVSYIGYLGSTGTPYIDYLIADESIIPPDNRKFYSEKIVYLPSYQMNDDKLALSGKRISRVQLGLPEQGFVFCSFNNNYKITPDVFGSWMRILDRVPGSILWLYVTNGTAQRNLKAEASKRGISDDRLVFAEWMSFDDHLIRQSAADLFLDTHPYNAGATASNALRLNLPVLTCIGNSFSGRMGASLLKAISLTQLVTSTSEEYEARAIELATNPSLMNQIRETLAKNIPGCALFNTERATRDMERAYSVIYERSQHGLPADHIIIPTIMPTTC